MKGARCFETKKAINYELEAHSHGGGENKKMRKLRSWWWPKYEGEKGEKCWLEILLVGMK